jgi:hypothetical protein
MVLWQDQAYRGREEAAAATERTWRLSHQVLYTYTTFKTTFYLFSQIVTKFLVFYFQLKF